jgi:ubiquinone/menaquinone biosynthesis C-methylase UbiE
MSGAGKLIYILTPEQAQQAPEQGGRTNEFPPLNAATTRHHYFGEKASQYDSDRDGDPKWEAENKAVYSILSRASGETPGLTIADIPCGTGRYFKYYEDLNLIFRGFDVSSEMMAIARKKHPKAAMEFGDVLDIPLGDKAVDALLCVRLLEKLTEAEMVAAITELARASSRHLILGLLTGNNVERRNRSWVHREGVFQDALAKSGFAVVDKYTVREPEYYIWHCERAGP